MGLKVKEETGGKKRYKARLVVKGFGQKKRVDFDEISFHVVKMTSIRIILSFTNIEDFIDQMDVKTSFFYGDLEEEFVCRSHVVLKSKEKKI